VKLIPSPALLTFVILVGSIDVSAATVIDCSIVQEGGRFKIDAHATLNVSGTASYAIISDVANFPRINPMVRRMEIIRRHDRDTRLEVEAYVCVLWYCDTLHEVQDMSFVRYPDGGEVIVNVVPEYSDFRYGHSVWQVRTSGGRTILHIVAELEPAFEIPPVIGPWLIKRALRAEALRTAEGIERLAHP
jgi:ribosome-associated toxin RatA of RatAB toxin-antitoxin module